MVYYKLNYLHEKIKIQFWCNLLYVTNTLKPGIHNSLKKKKCKKNNKNIIDINYLRIKVCLEVMFASNYENTPFPLYCWQIFDLLDCRYIMPVVKINSY